MLRIMLAFLLIHSIRAIREVKLAVEADTSETTLDSENAHKLPEDNLILENRTDCAEASGSKMEDVEQLGEAALS